MVTRTFTITTAEIVRADIDNDTLVRESRSFAGKLDEATIMKLLRKRGDTTVVDVKIVGTVTELRGMSADEFINHSDVIITGGRK